MTFYIFSLLLILYIFRMINYELIISFLALIQDKKENLKLLFYLNVPQNK